MKRPDAADPVAVLEAAFPDVDSVRPTRLARAPGRVNLIGDHTDYTGGLVLPIAIDREIRLHYLATADRVVELVRADTGDRDRFSLDQIGPARGGWIDYVAGTAWSLQAAGSATSGFRGVIDSSLPESVGLASSAALELASAQALLDGVPDHPRGRQLARLCRTAENRYVGVRCGVMDQMAIALARAGHALLLDCENLDVDHVPLSLPDHAVVVADTASPRRLSTSLYNQRVAECEEALATIRAIDPTVTGFRHLEPAAIESRRADLPPVLYRRASHVVTENQRVEDAAGALRAGDAGRIGELMVESHESLRHRFEVSSAELDTMVGIALEVPGVAGARMTGAGFGGCAVVLVRRTAVESLREAVESRYPAATGLVPRLFEVDAAAGAISDG